MPLFRIPLTSSFGFRCVGQVFFGTGASGDIPTRLCISLDPGDYSMWADYRDRLLPLTVPERNAKLTLRDGQ